MIATFDLITTTGLETMKEEKKDNYVNSKS